MSILLQITDQAAAKIKQLLQQSQNQDKKYLRILVESGGCSGFQYKYELVDQKDIDDNVIEQNGVIVLVDKMSELFIKDSSLEYIESLGNSYFEVRNPQAKTKCGCGNSFNV